MSEHDVTDDPLDPEIDGLLESERSRPEIPGTGISADRLLSRVLVTVGPLPPGEGGPSEPGTGPATGGSSAASTAAATTATLAHPVWVGAIALVIGIVAGAAMHATLASPEIRYVVRTSEPLARPNDAADRAPEPVERTPTEPTAVVAPPIEATVEPTPSEDPVRSARSRAPDAGVTTALSRESSLLHRAQSALARGAPELAITALREHELRHPEGQLREERDALWISALAAQGDRDGALARAARFRERFPGSPLQPAIDASLRAP